jgi:uncharacterized membrane protein YedE/YeeE
MKGLIVKLAVRFLKGKWGSLLPALLRSVAEGKLGERPKAIYWKTAGYRTFVGAALVGLGYGLGGVCGSYSETMAWACKAQGWVMALGALLAAVGLADGGTRAPWPDGTPKAEKE